MSLKGFHIVFIVLAVLCTLGFAFWVLQAPGEIITPSLQICGGVSGLSGVVLMAYGVWFIIKKSRKLIV